MVSGSSGSSDGARLLQSLRQILEPALLIALAALVLVDADSYPGAFEPGAPGPAFLPRILAALLIGGGVALAGRTVRRRRAGRLPEDRPPAGPRLRRWAPWVAGAWMAGALAALPVVGTLGTLPLLVAGLLWLAGERTPWILLGVPLAFSGLVWGLFVWLLAVPLP